MEKFCYALFYKDLVIPLNRPLRPIDNIDLINVINFNSVFANLSVHCKKEVSKKEG